MNVIAFLVDVTSLFTNVPLNKSINIILRRIYKENLVKTNMRKSILKKLIKGSCTKTAFSFDSSLQLVLAKVIITEFEKLVVGKLIKDSLGHL